MNQLRVKNNVEIGLNISNNISLYRKCISNYNMYIKGLNSPIKRRKKIWKENVERK